MAKIVLDPVASGYNLSLINDNFQKVEDELNNKVLYRNSPTGEPNQMETALDMNGNDLINIGNIGFTPETNLDMLGNKIINLGDGTDNNDAVNLGQVDDIVREILAEGGFNPAPKYQTLVAGQTTITTQVNPTTGYFYISDNDLDGLSRRMTPVTPSTPDGDYYIISNVEIELVTSFNDGALLTEIGGVNSQPVYSSQDPAGPLELIAHRGFAGITFENTTLAMSSAKSYGADSLEVDASISADGVWYAFHDSTVDADTDGTGTFTALQSSYLDTLKLTAADGTFYEGIRISRLSDVLDVARETGLKLYIEIKNIRTIDDVDALIALLRSYGIDEYCNVQSFSPTDLARVRAIHKTIETGYLVNSSDYVNIINTAISIGANVIINSYLQIRALPLQVTEYHKAGLDVVVYTSNFKDAFKEMARYGVRKIMSDRGTY